MPSTRQQAWWSKYFAIEMLILRIRGSALMDDVILYGQGHKDNQGFPRSGMARRRMFAYTQQGRANGAVLRIMQSFA